MEPEWDIRPAKDGRIRIILKSGNLRPFERQIDLDPAETVTARVETAKTQMLSSWRAALDAKTRLVR
jgi:hypothetical protein